MKIAIIQPRTPYHIAGSEKVFLKHAEFLSGLGHVIDFYTSIPKGLGDTGLFKEFIARKLPRINLFRFDISSSVPDLYRNDPDVGHVRWVTESLAFNERIFDELKSNRPDVILSYYLPDSILKPSGMPNVIYLSGYPSQPIPWYRAFIKFCDATISISSNVAQKWIEELKEVKFNYVLGTGVDYPLLIKSKIVSRAKYNLVYAGRLIKRKGVLTLLDAFRKIVTKNNDVHLWIIGDGELNTVLRNRIVDFGLNDNVTMTGVIDNPYDYFALADICLFPSHEGDGLMGTVLESMSAGKPVITTTNNGNEDVISNGESGILIEPKNIEAIVSAVNGLLDNDTQRKVMGKKAQSFIAQNSTWNKNAKQLSNVLVDVVERATKRL